MGWDVPWYSSHGSDFNYDFGVTHRRRTGSDTTTTVDVADGHELRDSASRTRCRAERFLRDDDRVFHTYSQYARGAEATGGSYYFLDLTALGRQEDWEEPKGRADSARAAQPDFAS